MLERIAAGELPQKPHTALRGSDDRLRYEECLTRAGFDGPFTVLYHQDRPHEATPEDTSLSLSPPVAVQGRKLLRRHYRAGALESEDGSGREEQCAVTARIPLLFNQVLTVSVLYPKKADTVYFSNGDADDLFYIQQGGGTLKTILGSLRFKAQDYVYVPKGLLSRFIPDSGPQFWLSLECKAGLGIPKQYRNGVGQLRMDAPYTHRDFRRPDFRGPEDEGIRRLIVKRADRIFAFEAPHNPFDVVGFDGTVYPWVFPITAFAPKVGAVHLPPTIHATFSTPGALICSFVPRPLDFHPDAIPCPYPHSSVDVDEVIFYSAGEFSSRKGVQAGSISHHPSGIPHGPHPGNYEASLGARSTNELAVMIDCQEALSATPAAVSVEDPHYHASFSEARHTER